MSNPAAPSAHPVRAYASLVRLSHTVFGLPFALTSAMLAHRQATMVGEEGLTWVKLLLILVAFTGARTAAMGFNRIVDRNFDAANPRTKDRELLTGAISLSAAKWFTALAALIFLGSAAALSPLAGLLAWPCLVVVLGYSYFKRFSWTSHLFLGSALALAPGGAWVAVLGDLRHPALPLALMTAVGTWVAGFDVIYSLQDESFDRRHGLHSIPARFGTRGALWLSGLLHLGTVAALIVVEQIGQLGGWHRCGVGLMSALLAYEHWLVRPNDLRRINRAFFDLNGYAGLAYLLCAGLAILRP